MKLLFIFGCCGLMMIFNAIFKRDVSELTNLYVVRANHYFYDMANTWKIDLHYLFNLFLKLRKCNTISLIIVITADMVHNIARRFGLRGIWVCAP